MSRLRIGHMTGKHSNGLCDHCQVSETEYVLVNCRKYVAERKDMMEEMKRLGLTGAGAQSALECGDRGQGRRCSVSLLTRTGLTRKT